MFAKSKILLILVLLQFGVLAQKGNIWLTYGEAKFMYTPGIEGNYYFNKHIGVQMGLQFFFEDVNPDQLANVSKFRSSDFYSLNINATSYIFTNEKHSLGFTSGIKLIMGPDYELLYRNELSDYEIYFNSAEFAGEFSLDLGLSYRYNRLTSLIKFDTSRKDFVFGLGYCFNDFK